jgi:intracellular sulfur oxidation DsrE/DsrF family protein
MKALLRLLVLTAATVLLPLSAVHAADSGSPPTKNRLVLQVADDGAKKWAHVLRNVSNIQDELGRQNVEIEVVVHGDGIGMLKEDTPVANDVLDAMATGVHFVACGRTMKAQKLTPDDMVKGIDYAGAGLVQLMQRQQQGWIYLRP